ncbi:MAG: FAD binding domain-containing protein [Myxococcota bacterium]
MLKVTYAREPQEAVKLCTASEGAEYKAGGTDVMDRFKQRTLMPSALINVSGMARELRYIRQSDDALTAGALTTLTELMEHPVVVERMPVLFQSTDHTATPQIRHVATVGGALCQRPRCVYLRHPDFQCRKKGGAVCYAQIGDSSTHAIFDNELCCAVHASTLGAALLALDATLEVWMPGENAARVVTMQEFFTLPEHNARVENSLPAGSFVEAVRIPLPMGVTKQAYERASPRLLADWGEVEVCAVLWLEGNRITDSRVVLGSVGRTPRRATETEARLKGQPLTRDVVVYAAQAAAAGARPLKDNQHKVTLTNNTVQATLEGLLS